MPFLCFVVLILTTLIACSNLGEPQPSRVDRSDAIAPLPTSHEECRASGGELEPRSRGGRCFAYFTPRRDASAYARCRDAGGAFRAIGPARSVSDQSHVCTLVFLPSE